MCICRIEFNHNHMIQHDDASDPGTTDQIRHLTFTEWDTFTCQSVKQVEDRWCPLIRGSPEDRFFFCITIAYFKDLLTTDCIVTKQAHMHTCTELL